MTPVHVYTSGDEAELFVNGRSYGRKKKDGYRVVWDDVAYQPGKIEVIAYKEGREWARDFQVTAGRPSKAVASVDYAGDDLIYVNVEILDRRDILVPDADNLLEFSLKGPGYIVASDAGDPTSHVPFYSHSLPAFHGKASVIVRRTGPGAIEVSAVSKGIKKASVVII